MSASKKGPIVDPGLCRCCGVQKKCRLLNFEYDWLGKKEVYSEMFVDCFGLVLSNLDGDESARLICATCVVRLRDATAFRQQVLRCEERLLYAAVHDNEAEKDGGIKLEVEIKQEEVTEEPLQEINHDEGTADESMDDHLSDADQINGDGGDARTEVDAGVNGTVSVEIKRESTPFSEPSTRRRKTTGRLRGRTQEDAATTEADTTHKTDMFNALQKMKEKINKKIQKGPGLKRTKSPQQRTKRPPIMDKEFNTLRNTLTIIENSYVTPFIAMFSDYHCVYCREMFLEPDKLREHTLEHDPRTYQEFLNTRKLSLVDIVRIDCRLCQTHIDDIDTFKEHITSVHNKLIYKNVDNEFIKFKLKPGRLTCLECGKIFNFFQALKKHMAEHFGTYICDECGAHYFEERHLVFHKNTHNKNRSIEMFPCTECDKTFRSKNSRNFHIARIHKNEAAYPCNKCDEVFISYHMRYRHKMNVHGEKREFPCEGCDKVYDCRKTLREHYQRTHLQLLRHECPFCDKKYYLPSALRDHMTSHTGERLYRCDYCGKNYPRKKALKVHLQSHNSEKKYKCALCPSSYTQANNYKNHMKSKHPMPAEYNETFR